MRMDVVEQRLKTVRRQEGEKEQRQALQPHGSLFKLSFSDRGNVQPFLFLLEVWKCGNKEAIRGRAALSVRVGRSVPRRARRDWACSPVNTTLRARVG